MTDHINANIDLTDHIITNIDLMVEPNLDTIHAVMSWLKAHDHCVVVFTPLEIGDADIEVMQDKMIEAGWDAKYGDSDMIIIPTN